MALTIRDTGRKFFPPWMSDRLLAGLVVGWKYIYCFLLQADLLIQFALEGTLARFPGFCPPEALPIIGRDRRITRGLVETDDSYAARLIGWLAAWKRAGSAYAILDQLAAYLGTAGTLRLVNANGTWYTRNPDGTRARHVTLPTKNWDWDAHPELWSRFWVVLYASDYGWTRDGTWGDGSTWGDDGTGWGVSNLPWQEVLDLRGIISTWKSAVAVCKNVVISFDLPSVYPAPTAAPGAPMPDGLWGSAYKIVAGVAVPSRDVRLLFCGGA
jgi:hypothetical protein